MSYSPFDFYPDYAYQSYGNASGNGRPIYLDDGLFYEDGGRRRAAQAAAARRAQEEALYADYVRQQQQQLYQAQVQERLRQQQYYQQQQLQQQRARQEQARKERVRQDEIRNELLRREEARQAQLRKKREAEVRRQQEEEERARQEEAARRTQLEAVHRQKIQQQLNNHEPELKNTFESLLDYFNSDVFGPRADAPKKTTSDRKSAGYQFVGYDNLGRALFAPVEELYPESDSGDDEFNDDDIVIGDANPPQVEEPSSPVPEPVELPENAPHLSTDEEFDVLDPNLNIRDVDADAEAPGKPLGSAQAKAPKTTTGKKMSPKPKSAGTQPQAKQPAPAPAAKTSAENLREFTITYDQIHTTYERLHNGTSETYAQASSRLKVMESACLKAEKLYTDLDGFRAAKKFRKRKHDLTTKAVTLADNLENAISALRERRAQLKTEEGIETPSVSSATPSTTASVSSPSLRHKVVLEEVPDAEDF